MRTETPTAETSTEIKTTPPRVESTLTLSGEIVSAPRVEGGWVEFDLCTSNHRDRFNKEAPVDEKAPFEVCVPDGLLDSHELKEGQTVQVEGKLDWPGDAELPVVTARRVIPVASDPHANSVRVTGELLEDFSPNPDDYWCCLLLYEGGLPPVPPDPDDDLAPWFDRVVVFTPFSVGETFGEIKAGQPVEIEGYLRSEYHHETGEPTVYLYAEKLSPIGPNIKQLLSDAGALSNSDVTLTATVLSHAQNPPGRWGRESGRVSATLDLPNPQLADLLAAETTIHYEGDPHYDWIRKTRQLKRGDHVTVTGRPTFAVDSTTGCPLLETIEVEYGEGRELLKLTKRARQPRKTRSCNPPEQSSLFHDSLLEHDSQLAGATHA